jgi:hypothetical protein
MVKLLESPIHADQNQNYTLTGIQDIADALAAFNDLGAKIEKSGGTEPQVIRDFGVAYKKLQALLTQYETSRYSLENYEKALQQGRVDALQDVEVAIKELYGELRMLVGFSNEDARAHSKLASAEKTLFTSGFHFSEKLESMDTRDLFTLKTGPGSTVYPLVRETVAACLMELTAPQIAQAYLTEQGLDASGLEERIREIEASSPWVEVRLQTLEGEALSLPELTGFGAKQILVRLTGVLAMLWSLYLTADLGALLDSPQGRRLRVLRRPAAILLPQALAALVPMAMWALILALLLGGAAAFLTCAALQTVLLGLGLTVPRSRRLRESVTVLLPFLALGSVLLEPVLVDTASLFPKVAPWLSWLPVTLFCRGCDGSLWAVGALMLEGLGLCALSLLPDRH